MLHNNKILLFFLLFVLMFFISITLSAQSIIKVNVCEDFLIKYKDKINLLLVIGNDTIKGINNANEYIFLMQDISSNLEKVEIILQQKKYEYSYSLTSYAVKNFLTDCDNIKICIKKQKNNMTFMHSCYNSGITGILKKRW